MIKNLQFVGCNVVVDGQGNRKKVWQIKRKERINEQTYQMSRWTPCLKDIIEDCIDERIDNSHFPFLGGQRQGSSGFSAPSSGRYGGWHSRETQANVQKNVPRVLVYIMGGMTFSEFRVGYEITNDRKNWEVIVGGSQILTPEGFLNKIKALSESDDTGDE